MKANNPLPFSALTRKTGNDSQGERVHLQTTTLVDDQRGFFTERTETKPLKKSPGENSQAAAT